MMKIILLVWFHWSHFWGSYLCININETVFFDASNLIRNYSIPYDGDYELIAAGAGGGVDNLGTSGGKGGRIASNMQLKKNDLIFYAIGDIGKPVSLVCGSAGGGGATIVSINSGSCTPQLGNLRLIGPGGGGAGYNQKPNDPDYQELTDAIGLANCVKSKFSDQLVAAEGRSYKAGLLNYSYNPTLAESNMTSGCLGGFGGGGEGGFTNNLNFSGPGGGGGGGGGLQGGKTSIDGAYGVCTAGGPGKPFCSNAKCAVARSNSDFQGYFRIQIFIPYQPLPKLDRTNYERPRNQQNFGLHGKIVKFSFWILITSITISLFVR